MSLPAAESKFLCVVEMPPHLRRARFVVWQVDVMRALGVVHRQIARIWPAARPVFSNFSAHVTLCSPAITDSRDGPAQAVDSPLPPPRPAVGTTTPSKKRAGAAISGAGGPR